MSMEPESVRSRAHASEGEFFCEKYQVWYPMQDCNYRVRNATYHGCVNCFQGRVNLRAPQPVSETEADSSAQLIPFPQPPVASGKSRNTAG